MNQLSSYILHFCLMVLLIPFNVSGQDTHTNNTSKDELITAAQEIIEAAGTCALITLDQQFVPMVRIMDPFPPESDFTIWFGTKSESRKVNHILKNPTVTIYYQDSDDSGYVVIHGKAKIVDDPKEKEQRWKDQWEPFYPNNREGYTLIKVSPEWMEILSYTRGIIGDPKTWQTPIVEFN